ncbi:MAG TPA: phosphatase PAP2 family protein [Pricia sp.]|uniref:Phosphatase PAP2 family protein n=2 Tax=root TaxID=1 RepID=A0A831VQ03_9FLAO|nr:phosphatase PAP2 family protein [Pricia sp.]HEA20163.1 phosphatase PAP2 family protein [Pricia antarctica]
MNCKIFLAIFFLLVSTIGYSQIDTVHIKPKRTLLYKSILPAGLIASGILLSDSKFEKSLNRETRNRVGNSFNYGIDEYTRFAPTALMYIGDLAGVEAKNHWFDQTKNMTLSIIITDIITNTMKRHIYKVRPDGSNAKSFPSGHSSLTFTSAAVLYEEFSDTSPLLAYSGYGFAAVTGSFRMLNNRHYLSDVLAGAGIGILVAKLVYHFDYLFKWNPFLKSKDMTLIPRYEHGTAGIYFSKTF